MSSSGVPYWPGDTNSQIYQTLGYNSTTQVLSLSPFGNSVDLTTSGSGGSFSTITVSSIQGNVTFQGNVRTLPGNPITAQGGINMSNTTLQFSQTGTAVAYYNAGNSNLYIQAPSTAVVAIGTTSNAAQIQVGDTSINMPTAVYMNQGVVTASGTGRFTVQETGGANSVVIGANNVGQAYISSTGAGLDLQNIRTLNALQPALFDPQPSQTPAFIQSGYCQDVPYGASTIMFALPYTTDNVTVMLTPTNRGTSGGANPECSLGNSYGPNGNGVSSIGFQVDTRNNGVGYNGSFFWMAMPRNT